VFHRPRVNGESQRPFRRRPPDENRRPCRTCRCAAYDRAARQPAKRVTLAADKGYDVEDFVNELRTMRVTPHVAQNTSGRSSAINRRTTRHMKATGSASAFESGLRRASVGSKRSRVKRRRSFGVATGWASLSPSQLPPIIWSGYRSCSQRREPEAQSTELWPKVGDDGVRRAA
jgi:hypothetical protein